MTSSVESRARLYDARDALSDLEHVHSVDVFGPGSGRAVNSWSIEITCYTDEVPHTILRELALVEATLRPRHGGMQGEHAEIVATV
jgi:hypothetical protein